MNAYQWLLVPKFIGVVLFAAGAGGVWLAESEARRKIAVHRVAGAGLMLTWLFGFAAVHVAGIRLTEPWIVGSLATSFVAQGALTTAAKSRSAGAKAVAALAIAATVVLMIARPVRA